MPGITIPYFPSFFKCAKHGNFLAHPKKLEKPTTIGFPGFRGFLESTGFHKNPK